jgi:hypothetical protein
MRRNWRKWLSSALSGTLVVVSSAQAQQASPTSEPLLVVGEQPGREKALKEELAESIVLREETASGKAFDPSYRAQAKRALASLSLEALESRAQQRGLGVLAPGDSQSDLLYVPLTPCRIIDTRLAGGPIAAGTTRDFSVTGTNLSSQGGSATGCKVPVGPATSAVINFVAVNPAGGGDLRQTPFGTPMPLASFLNYVNSGIPNDNTANGSVTTICDPATSTCTKDFTIQADVAAVQLVADVEGFFENFSPTLSPRVGFSTVTIPAAGVTPVQLATITFTPRFTGTASVGARGWCNVNANALVNEVNIAVGPDAVTAFAGSPAMWGVVGIPANAGLYQLSFSAALALSTTRGVAQTIAVFGRRQTGTAATDCSGSLTVSELF